MPPVDMQVLRLLREMSCCDQGTETLTLLPELMGTHGVVGLCSVSGQMHIN